METTYLTKNTYFHENVTFNVNGQLSMVNFVKLAVKCSNKLQIALTMSAIDNLATATWFWNCN